MSRKPLMAVALVCAAIAITWIVFGRREPFRRVSPGDFPQTLPKPDLNAVVSATPAKSVIPEPTPQASPQQALENAFRTPISFWGKAIDQDNVPVGDAEVRISVSEHGDAATNYATKTDSNGQFSVTGLHGLALSAVVSKEGYYRTKGSSRVYGYAAGVSGDGPPPTADRPAIFVLRKKGQGIPLVKSGVRVTSPRVNFPVGVNLMTGQLGAPNEGNIVLTLENSGAEKVSTAHRYDWTFQIQINGGGLVEREDQFDFTAPADGYKDSARIAVSADAGKWLPQLERDYFIRLADNRYARVKIFVNSGHNPFITLTSYVNPTPGDRNLESESPQR